VKRILTTRIKTTIPLAQRASKLLKLDILKEENRMKNVFTVLLCAAALMFVGCDSDDDSTTTTPEAGAAGEGGAAGEAEGGAAGEAEGGAAGEAEGGAAGEVEGGAAGEAEGGSAGEPETADIIDTAVAAGDFTLLAAALETAGLIDVLKGEGPFTVFAPNDAAVTAALEALGVTAEEFLARDDLQQILLYHVISGAAIASTDLDSAQVADTAAPSGLSEGSTLSAIITADETGVMINGAASVVTADIVASNGIIHVIDSVLLPPSIFELAVAYPDFNTLVAATAAASLVETLSSPGPFTVFAPTDDAFVAALEAMMMTAEELLASDDLAGILTYHAVAGFVLSTDLVAGEQTVATVAGPDVTVNVTDEGVTVNDANVLMTDIVGTNGVIHVIDGVLLPPPAM
jgi:transforming growth factor-beta-induced protein